MNRAGNAKEELFTILTECRVAKDRVLSAMMAVPRDNFVPDTFKIYAWKNVALPIGRGQTISQPEIVALMTESLQVNKQHNVLEIGTGSGYQTAILSLLCKNLYSIERERSLLKQAETRILNLGIDTVTFRHGDGSLGWPEKAPFDRIIVTAAAEHDVPFALLEQLDTGGRMVVPVAFSPIDQQLLLIRRLEDDMIVRESLGMVRFVPLVTAAIEKVHNEPVTRALTRLRRQR